MAETMLSGSAALKQNLLSDFQQPSTSLSRPLSSYGLYFLHRRQPGPVFEARAQPQRLSLRAELIYSDIRVDGKAKSA